MAAKYLIGALLLIPGLAHAGSCVDAANFTPKATISSKFADFPPGQKAVFSDGEEEATVSVTPYFVKSDGIWWRVVTDFSRDLSTSILGESTVDLYAKNKQGDICYGGEITDAWVYNSTDNLLATEDDGSFVHNIGGVRAGLYMPANPVVGQTWTIESLDGGATREVARVTSVTSTLLKIRITHFEDGVQVEVEDKEFDNRGEIRAQVPGEPISRRVSITPL